MTVFIENRVKGHYTNGKMAISSNSTYIALHGNDGKFNKHLCWFASPKFFSSFKYSVIFWVVFYKY